MQAVEKGEPDECGMHKLGKARRAEIGSIGSGCGTVFARLAATSAREETVWVAWRRRVALLAWLFARHPHVPARQRLLNRVWLPLLQPAGQQHLVQPYSILAAVLEELRVPGKKG